MEKRTHKRLFPLALLSLCALAGTLVPVSVTARSARAASPIYVTSETSFHTTMVRNFNPFTAATTLDFTLGAIYEPLYIITTAGGGREYPWLATAYKWTDGGKTLLITIRHGVRWSDGVPFTNKDVLYTFTAGTSNAIVDQIGYVPRSSSNITSVSLAGSDGVAVHFKKVDVTALQTLLSNVKILPQHIWSKVKNPATFTNPDPVGTGPFTQIAKFTGQEYILGKNPYYWQKLSYDGIRVPAYTGNDSANLSMVHGDLDWTGDFVPNVQKVYVAKDPVHFHYFYATNNTPNALVFNDQVYPYSLVNFRKAISYAIDRQKVYLIGEYGYQPPSDAIGIASQWPAWVDKSIEPQAKELATYNPTKAKAVLAKNGFTWKSGQLYDPKGHKVSIQLSVIGGWSDWVLSLQIIQKNLQAIGIDASVKLMDVNTWNDKAYKGLLSAYFTPWTNGGATPFYYFDAYMSQHSYTPTGQDASAKGTNWERWWSPQADKLLTEFKTSTDAGTQHAAIDGLQKIQLEQMPMIPVMTGATWYTYSTLHFTGWPTQNNYYAIGAPWQYPDVTKVLTTIQPVK